MKLIEYHCPNCTATLQVDVEKQEAVCEYCGSRFEIEDERRDAEKEGYDFELGRMRARDEMSAGQQDGYYPSVQVQNRNKRLWLWVLGWIFFFPIPLTVIIVRSQRISNSIKIVLLMLLWGFVVFATIFNNTTDGSSQSAALTAIAGLI